MDEEDSVICETQPHTHSQPVPVPAPVDDEDARAFNPIFSTNIRVNTYSIRAASQPPATSTHNDKATTADRKVVGGVSGGRTGYLNMQHHPQGPPTTAIKHTLSSSGDRR